MNAHQIFSAYFGYPLGAVYSNLIASVICVGLAWWRLRLQSARQHTQQLAQKALHHAALLDQVTKQHAELKALAEKHHQEHLDRADVHAAATQAHVTKTASAPAVPVQAIQAVVDESLKAAARKERATRPMGPQPPRPGNQPSPQAKIATPEQAKTGGERL